MQNKSPMKPNSHDLKSSVTYKLHGICFFVGYMWICFPPFYETILQRSFYTLGWMLHDVEWLSGQLKA
jgi:hypothetical protein